MARNRMYGVIDGNALASDPVKVYGSGEEMRLAKENKALKTAALRMFVSASDEAGTDDAFRDLAALCGLDASNIGPNGKDEFNAAARVALAAL